MVGLPGAGKTTLAKRLEKETGSIRLSPDEWMHDLGFDSYDEAAREKVEKRLWLLCQQLLSHNQSVIMENGFWSKKERDHIRAKASSMGAKVQICYLKVSLDELEQRLRKRDSDPDDKSAHVSREQLEEWSRVFQPPTAEELS